MCLHICVSLFIGFMLLESLLYLSPIFKNFSDEFDHLLTSSIELLFRLLQTPTEFFLCSWPGLLQCDLFDSALNNLISQFILRAKMPKLQCLWQQIPLELSTLKTLRFFHLQQEQAL